MQSASTWVSIVEVCALGAFLCVFISVNLGHFELVNREMVLDWWQSKATAMILQVVPVRSFIIEWYICTHSEMQVAAT